MTSRHITAAEVQHQKILRKDSGEIKRAQEREGKKSQPPERERALVILSMMIFDSATSSFLALLVIKPYKKPYKFNI